MNKFMYDVIGNKYNINRCADSRVVKRIKDLLGLPAGSLIADIGAGSGNYSNALADLGYQIIAMEPSREMRSQAVVKKGVRWISGIAESIPLADSSVDGVIAILAIHHFTSLQRAIREMGRICPRGPAAIFTLDPRESEAFWFIDYFPDIYRQELIDFPAIEEIAARVTKVNRWFCTIDRFLLPHDLSDLYMRSGWNRPEIYLDHRVRQNTSGFALASDKFVRQGIEKLQTDLQSGRWDKNHGDLRKRGSFDAGFRFLQFRA